MTRDELIARIEGDTGMQDALDDLVHDCHAQQAAEVNNRGIEAQVAHLIKEHGMSLKEIAADVAAEVEGREVPFSDPLDHDHSMNG